MNMERSRCFIKGVSQKKVISHDELMSRIRKTLYYGSEYYDDDDELSNNNADELSNDKDDELSNDDDEFSFWYGELDGDSEISRPLAEYASDLFSEPHKGHSLNRLNIVTVGKLDASPCTLIMALIYLDRLNSNDPNYVRRITPSKLFIVSMIISTKFYSDYDEEIHLNEWAERGCISLKHLKELEMEFLYAIDWNIYISNEEFFEKLETIEKIISQREGIRRGWLTYTELINLLPSIRIVKYFLNNIAIISVSYAASVMTIASAFFIYSYIPGNVLQINNNNNNNDGYNHQNVMNTTISSLSSISTMTTNTATTITEELIIDTLDLLCKNLEDTKKNSIIDLNVNGSCQAANIEDELKMLLKQNRQYTNSDRNTNKNDDVHNDANGNYIRKCYKNNDCDNNFMMEKNFKHTNLGNDNNNLKDQNSNENSCLTESIMNYTISILSYLIKDESKSLIEIISFNWFKFI